MNDWSPFLGLPLWAWLFVLPTLFVIACRIFSDTAKIILQPIWSILDKLYVASGVLAAICMVIILALIIAQMVARWTGVSFEGSSEFAGYAMAATSFFALAYTLNHGAHIRVSILLNINNFTRMWIDAFAMLVAAITATYFARFAVKTNFMSEMLNDRTQGQDQVPEWLLSIFTMFKSSPAEWGQIWEAASDKLVFTPVWLPQLPMSIGTILLAIALWDNLARLLINGKSRIKAEILE